LINDVKYSSAGKLTKRRVVVYIANTCHNNCYMVTSWLYLFTYQPTYLLTYLEANRKSVSNCIRSTLSPKCHIRSGEWSSVTCQGVAGMPQAKHSSSLYYTRAVSTYKCCTPGKKRQKGRGTLCIARRFLVASIT